MKISHIDNSLIEKTVKKIDDLADKARLAVVGDPVRVKEYEMAEIGAKSYRDAGYAGAVPEVVRAWAEAKNWTPQQSADDIIAASDRWYAALFAIRELRLKAKEAIKASTSKAQADAMFSQYEASITVILNLV